MKCNMEKIVNEIIEKSKNCELITRKKIANIIEKILRCCGYDFRHDIFKQVVYGEIEYNTPFEEKIKNYYDSFNYLLANSCNPLTQSLLKKFFYLLDKENLDQYMFLRIASYSFFVNEENLVEEFVDFHIFIYKELYFLSEDERIIISWMFLNYFLVKHNIPCIRLLKTDFDKYVLARNFYLQGNKENLINLITNIILKEKFQTLDFYNYLRPISKDEIVSLIKEDEDKLKNKYRILKIYLYGSFAKGLARIDSDIDLMVMFSEEVSYEEKLKIIEEVSIYYENKMHRYIDISEISTYLTDDYLKEHTRVIKIY